MNRLAYAGILLAGALLSILFFYRTEPTFTEPEVSVPTQAEFGGVSLRLDYATTTASRELGLGGRTSIPDNYGMLFVFPKDGFFGFWMKDTLVPLDMFWLDSKGHVVSIAERVATSSYPNVFYSSVPVRYVLETIAGFARAHSIATGTPLLLKNFPSVSQ